MDLLSSLYLFLHIQIPGTLPAFPHGAPVGVSVSASTSRPVNGSSVGSVITNISRDEQQPTTIQSGTAPATPFYPKSPIPVPIPSDKQWINQPGYKAVCADGTPAQGSCQTPDGSK